MEKTKKLVQELSMILFRRKTLPTFLDEVGCCLVKIMDMCQNDQLVLQILLNLEADETFPQITIFFGRELLTKACHMNFIGTAIFLASKCSGVEVLESTDCIQYAQENGFVELNTFLLEFLAEQRRRSKVEPASSRCTSDLKQDEKESFSFECQCENFSAKSSIVDGILSEDPIEIERSVDERGDVCGFRASSSCDLCTACEQGNLEVVTHLVQECGRKVQNHSLVKACRHGHLNLVKFLIGFGLDPCAPCSKGFLPIVESCLGGHFDILLYLVEEYNVDPNCCDRHGSTPLLISCKNGHLAIVKYLIEDRGVNQKYDDMDSGENSQQIQSPLHEAAVGGHLEVVRYLIEMVGFDPNETDEFTNKPTFLCAEENGHLKVAKYLASEGRKHSNRMSSFGISDYPLMMACHYNSLEMVRFLVETGSDPNGCDSFRPVHEAVEHCSENTLKYLLEMGTMPNITDGKGKIPLILAIKLGYLSMVKILCEYVGTQKNELFGKYCPVTAACVSYRTEIVCYLLENGFSADEIDENGNTPLLTSLGKVYWKTDIDLVRTLVQKGNIDVSNDFKFTPLLRAIENRNYTGVKALVNHGAVLNLDQKSAFKYPLRFFENSPIDTGYALPCAILRYIIQNNALQPDPVTARAKCLNIVSYEKPFELYKVHTGTLLLLLKAGYKLPTISRMTKLWPEFVTSGRADRDLLYKLVMTLDSTVRTLKFQCILAVRASVGSSLAEKIRKLQVPHELIQALSLPQLKELETE